MDLNENKQKLLKTLYDEHDYVSAFVLSSRLGISQRQVRYLIQKLNEEKKIVQSSNKGYKLNDSYTLLYEYENKDVGPNNAQGRKKFIFEKLVIANQVRSIDELLDLFSISESLFNYELQIWKKELSEYNLYLKTKRGNIFSIGKERDRQRFAMDIIKNELTGSAFSIENIQQYFRNVDLKQLKSLVLDVFSKQQYYLDDYSLLTYILHIAMRIELSENISDSQDPITDINDMELTAITIQPIVKDIVEEIIDRLSTLYKDVHFSKEDIMEASLLMATRLLPKNSSEYLFYSDCKQIVGEEVADLYETILAEINEIYAVDISSYRFMYRFSLHIKNLIYRVKNNIALKEGQFTDIKDHYPFLFTIAVHIAFLISQHIGMPVPENEICYIALHVGAILEEKNVKGNRIVCAVLAPDYYETAKNISDRVEKHFDDVFVATIASNYDQFKNSKIRHDLLISTYPVSSMEVSSVVVGPFLEKHDIEKIENAIFQIKERKRKNDIIEDIEKYFLPDICFFDQKFTSSDQVIDSICDHLFNLGLTRSDFKEAILDHEKIAPSSYANFVLAHTLTNNDKRTFISLVINPDKIQWGENEVNIIFFISINKKDRGKFKRIFDSITNIMFEEGMCSRILACRNYEEFIDVIYRYL